MDKIGYIKPQCNNCKKMIGLYEEPYKLLLAEKIPISQIWEKLGITNICCKMNIMCEIRRPLGVIYYGIVDNFEYDLLNSSSTPEVEVKDSLFLLQNNINSVSEKKFPIYSIDDYQPINHIMDASSLKLSNLLPGRIIDVISENDINKVI